MACRLDGAKPLSEVLNQCWNTVDCTLKNKLQWNFNRNSNIITYSFKKMHVKYSFRNGVHFFVCLNVLISLNIMLEISFVCCMVQFIMMSPTALRWQRHKRHCDGSGRTWLSLWTQNGYPTPRPYGRAVEYLLWRFEVNRPHYNGSAEYEGASKYNSQGLSNGLVPNIAKPLTEPVLTYCQLSIGHKEPPPSPMKFEAKYQVCLSEFSFANMDWSAKWQPICPCHTFAEVVPEPALCMGACISQLIV